MSDAERNSDAGHPRRAGWATAALIAWIAFIFGTSCTVIRPAEFFQLIHRHVITDERFFRGFEVFWGVSWFAIIKGWHAREFAILFSLTATLVARLSGGYSARGIITAAAIAIAFAISDEWHQSFVPARNGTAQDVLIDSLGVLIAAAFVQWRMRKSGPTHLTA